MKGILCDYLEFLRYPFDHSFELFGRKWTAPILTELFNGKDRFNTLLETIPAMNPRTLAIRLNDLETQGLISREVDKSSSPRIRYRITKKGEDLRKLMLEMATFSIRWSRLAATHD